MQNFRLANRINLYTIIAVYFLILVGGIVRSTGSGMGCPDWPKCFGEYIPPTDDSGLPENYQQAYVDARLRKNLRFSSVLSGLGLNELAVKVANDPEITTVTYFDATKAWIEYVNRLVGVTIGFLIVLNMWFSFKYWNTKRSITWLGVVSFVLVLFQAWIGSLVVSTHLLPGFISFHMLLALLEVMLLMIQRYQMTDGGYVQLAGRGWLLTLMCLFAIQIVLGIQVREEVDIFKEQLDAPRLEWIAGLDWWFYIHRSFSILLLTLVGWFYYQNWKLHQVNRLMNLLAGVVVMEIVLGIVMAYLGVPAFAQPLHLLLGTGAFGVIFYLFLYSNLKVNKS